MKQIFTWFTLIGIIKENNFHFRKTQAKYDEFENLNEEEKMAALKELKSYNDANS